MLLLSGGIDSPVAGWMMAKRGVALDCVHFESYPYTSEQAREKVLELARLLSRWCGPVRVHIISLTHIQEELRRADVDDYFTLLLRRYMMRLACRAARRFRCDAIITGESLGQVASQTMGAFRVTGSVADRIVFRPCIGMDKEEIVALARRIGTFDTSILPYEDCCTVFTPKHPVVQSVKAQPPPASSNALRQRAVMSGSASDILLKTEIIGLSPTSFFISGLRELSGILASSTSMTMSTRGRLSLIIRRVRAI